jgi:hypothetical protein
MISQLPLWASENNKLEDLISRMQLTGALLSRHPQAVCPRQKLRPVDTVSPYAPPSKPNCSRGGGFDAPYPLHGPQARESMPLDLKGENMSGDAHVR